MSTSALEAHVSAQIADGLAKIGPDNPETPHSMRLAVAVSGGADSMALFHLVRENWPAEKLIAMTVDHGLRAAAAQEAVMVKRWIEACGVRHLTLEISPKANAAEARHARYAALETAAVRDGAVALLLAHHLDDQAETLLLALRRAGGVDRLSGMAAVSPALTRADGPPRMRPLLDVSKTDLERYLSSTKRRWISDPTNGTFSAVEMAGERARWRHVRHSHPVLDHMLPIEAVARSAGFLREASATLQAQLEDISTRLVTWHRLGWCHFPLADFSALSAQLRWGLLSKLIVRVHPTAHPRGAQVGRALDRLSLGQARGFTLAGCHFEIRGGLSGPAAQTEALKREDQDHILICREASDIADIIQVKPETDALSGMRPSKMAWDRRLQLDIKSISGGGEIRVLGEAGWARLTEEDRALFQDLPWPVRKSLPAFWSQDGRVFIVPTAPLSFG
ncbi:MAG: tRNA lysidine(34) synthetase TilS [Pseudomonadota bacterium]